MRWSPSLMTACALACSIGAACAQDAPPTEPKLLVERDVSADLALAIARGAIDACRTAGYEVSVAVVGRDGLVRLAVRGDGAAPHTFELARRKAYTARTFRRTSADWAKRMTNEPELSGQRMLRGVIPLGGGVPINAGSETIGGVGVSGSPGQDKDEACAAAGLARVAAALK